MSKTPTKHKTPNFPPWARVDATLRVSGWSLEVKTKDRISYLRDKEKLSIFKTPFGKWKVDYSVNNRLMDTAGPTDEGFAKVLAIEMGVLR